MKNNLSKVESVFLLGSEWLYFKVYMGSATAESTIINLLNPMIKTLLRERIIDKWFFVNYNDPNQHIRIRFHLIDNKKDLGHLINVFNVIITPLLNSYLIYDIQASLYKRELERYGNSKIVEFETLFYLNSNLVVNIWKLIDKDENLRWLYALKCIDHFIDEWGFSLKDKIAFCDSMEQAYSEEMKSSTVINQNLAKKYRKYRPNIENIFTQENYEIDLILKLHKEESNPIIEKILDNCDDTIINGFLSSYIHMFCNRFFLSKQRLNEWVLYYFLTKHYNSVKARKKYLKSNEETSLNEI